MLLIRQRGLTITLMMICLLLASVLVPHAGAVTYTYDDLNRLTRVEYGDGTVIEYSYDSAGNRLQRTVQTADTTPPTTTAAPLGGTYNTPQTVTLTCNDGTGSGCQGTYYTNDGTTPTIASSVYASPIAISTTTTLKFFSRDLAGNNESVKTQTYTIYTAPPVTIPSPGGGVYFASQSITLTCSDPQGPGCDKTYYTTDGTSPTTASPVYSAPIALSSTTTLKFFSRDVVGNSETVKSETYTLDTTPPSGTIVINSGAGITNSPDVTLTLSCTDQFGCSQMRFSNDNITYSSPETFAATKNWTVTAGEGTKTVYVKYSDSFGLWSSPFSVTISLNLRVKVLGGPYYSTIQAAYDAVPDGATIQCRAIPYTESLTANRNITVTLQGGYDSGFTTNTGDQTMLTGMIATTAGGGAITIGNFVLEQ